MKVVIGTRGSALALAQAQYVRNRLAQTYPKDEFVLKTIRTTGDREQNRALWEIGEKGLFVKEIEQELLEHKIDMAVHSMKDLPSALPDGLCFAKAWEREDARDVLILREAKSLQELREHAIIGTGSLRRTWQLFALRKDLRIAGIRGNIETRIEKMYSEKMDGIVLAAAGLKRLDKEDLIAQYLDISQMVPAAAQGQLGLELRKGDRRLLRAVNALSDKAAQKALQTERLFLQKTGGGCYSPVGAYARILADKRIELSVFYANANGSKKARCKVTGKTPERVVELAREEILHKIL